MNFPREGQAGEEEAEEEEELPPPHNFRGVERREGNRWYARLYIPSTHRRPGENKVFNIGVFSSAIEAARGYDDAARARGLDESRMNFPERHPHLKRPLDAAQPPARKQARVMPLPPPLPPKPLPTDPVLAALEIARRARKAARRAELQAAVVEAQALVAYHASRLAAAEEEAAVLRAQLRVPPRVASTRD